MQERNPQETEVIAAAGLTHVDLDPSVKQVQVEEDDFLAGKKACSVNDPDCESCQ